jgi:sec-independent protein translocase protein TatC
MQQIENNEQQNTNEEGMPFLSHLEELRKRILIALVGLVIGCLIAGLFVEDLMSLILLRPAVEANIKLQNLRPFGQAFLFFKVVFVSGIIFSFPFMLYQLWLFVAPGLYESEKSWAGKITFFTTLCFLIGISFAYFVMIPGMLSFTASFGSSDIENQIDVTYYFGFITTTILAAGLIFELPMISFVLTRIGIITPQFLRKYRRHAIIIILIIAAILTPSPDPFNQLVFAIPLWGLYELSIVVSVMTKRRKEMPNTATM